MKVSNFNITNDKTWDLDDLYYEISHDWEGKAKALQVRRWRTLKREVKHRGWQQDKPGHRSSGHYLKGGYRYATH